ncbi:RNA-directed DNA polymerase, eukaryota, Reverse transcriptase zinc-binding domain protein [Artemisia annua]|uniref:RNA-directed DNA polymerase, eukaryota, Reverse transcriptase zinc-binding domain protein n=1 Tax=Artemisia annua TaxID=35608 RepID=A0A2U1N2L0_ARTAN|nr:RNA-directed DNA polymerase, eukaryota, Reverse transcriptase zinc-binding domain protein [Artemisia annua]
MTVNIEDMRCPLCNIVQDTHTHLFFECGFSLQVWLKVKAYILITNVGNSWMDFVLAVKSIAHMRLEKAVVASILFGATVYFIWQERNNRLFKKKWRPVDQVFDIIFSTTRLKLMTLKFKDSVYVA